MEVGEAWATGEEAREIQDVIRNTIQNAADEGRLPKRVGREFEVEYREDLSGSPAAWIWLSVNDDDRPSEQDVKLMTELSTRIEQAILKKSRRHWPYIAYGRRR